jgi:hypothetical protein
LYAWFGGGTEEKIQLGRPRRRWEDNIKMDFNLYPVNVDNIVNF